jgi:two-component system LytT family response regulator
MPRTLLIDDEPAARAELRWLLSAHPGYPIVGEAATFTLARQLLTTVEYDLVLLDIQLIGGTGFDLVGFVRPAARIIFITAYDQHALRAFEVNALDYLLKPVSNHRFAAALARLTAATAATTARLAAATAPAPLPPGGLQLDDRILLKLDSANERFVRLGDIRSISSAENYTEVVLGTGEKLFVRRTMKSWEDTLPAAEFARVHRHTIVACAHIERIVRHDRANFEVILRGASAPLPVSYRLIPELRARLGARCPEA